jgi:dTDP-glucose 4,6-dehydratase
MIIYVDIDETICEYMGERNYPDARPIVENIEKINNLYDDGNTIIYWTARGTVTGIDWREVTENQFREWGVKYHDLKFGKPAYDLFIDDKNINSETFFKNN